MQQTVPVQPSLRILPLQAAVAGLLSINYNSEAGGLIVGGYTTMDRSGVGNIVAGSFQRDFV